MAGDVIHVDDAEFAREVLQSAEPVLVDFSAAWCAPCRAIGPAIEELATQYKGKVRVAKLDVDESQDTAERYGIRSLPTLLLFKDGRVVKQIVGAVPKSKLDEALRSAV